MPNPGQSYFKVYWSSGPPDIVPCQFNPTQITIEKAVQYAEINIPGLLSPLQQFIRGQAETLNLELFFDTSDQGMGVDAVSVVTMTDQIYSFTHIEPNGHTPPIVEFFCGAGFPGSSLLPTVQQQHRYSFKGIVSSIRQVFTLWSSFGVPLRAKLTLTIKEYLTLNDQLNQLNLSSPDKTHSHVIARGETLGAIAYQYYTDCTSWRNIADANAIDDPRRLMPGRQVTVPSIPGG